MLPSEIMAKLNAGEFDIRYEQKCDCRFNWTVANDSLYDGVEAGCCWEGFVLYVADVAIAEMIHFDEKRVLVEWMSNCDIPEEIWDQMRPSDYVKVRETGNLTVHDLRRFVALVEWLMDAGFELVLDKYKDRGFAKEHTVVLRNSARPVINSRQDVENWVNRFRSSGDSAAPGYIGFRLE
jgi:hypothetical protein